MNEIYLDNSDQNRNIMKHLGFSLYELHRSDEAIHYLKIYIKLTKNKGKYRKTNKQNLSKAYYYS